MQTLKRNIFIFTILMAFAGCQSGTSTVNQGAKEKGFVYLNGKQFMLNDSLFFPVLMNYMLDFMEVDGEIIPVPNVQYDSQYVHIGASKEQWIQQVENHFELLSNLGFNTIRLVGYNSDKYNELGEILINLYDPFGNYERVKFEDNHDKFESAVKKTVELAKKHDLKVMILLPNHRQDSIEEKSRIDFIQSSYALFREENTVFSYDLCNEPLYFDKADAKAGVDQSRTKLSALQLVTSWNKLFDSLVPYQLSTIGFGEPLEVFEWDASILPIDFVSFHTYNPLRVPNEIYWWSNFIDKPLLISETSLPSDNDSIPYSAQSDFIEAAYKRAVDCGISGFGWWQFQDVYWGDNYEHNYTALLDHKGTTYLEDSSKIIYGGLKPAAIKLKSLLSYKSTGKCDCYNNYENIVGYKNYRIDGYIRDNVTHEPIEGAIIRGYIVDWTIASNTFTDKKGHFSLYSNDKIVNFNITAPGYEMIYHFHEAEYEKNEINETINEVDLEYQKIHFGDFLMNDSSNSNGIFTFNSNYFNQFVYYGKIGVLKLNKLDLNETLK